VSLVKIKLDLSFDSYCPVVLRYEPRLQKTEDGHPVLCGFDLFAALVETNSFCASVTAARWFHVTGPTLQKEEDGAPSA
jgi:hypothetical protein